MKKTLLLGLGGLGTEIVCKVKSGVSDWMQPTDVDACAVIDMDHYTREYLAKNKEGDIFYFDICPCISVRDAITALGNEHIDRWYPCHSVVRYGDLRGSRPNARLALYYQIRMGNMAQFDAFLSDVILSHTQVSQVQVVIATSLCGNTGSGIFLQIAMYLKRYMREHNIRCAVHGMFVMPEAFIGSYEVLREDPAKRMHLYTNTHASLLELEALSCEGDDTLYQQLFSDIGPLSFRAQPYDYVTLFAPSEDVRNLNGYTNEIAQQIALRCFSPIAFSLYQNGAQTSMRYERCGVSKILYAQQSVQAYCGLRAFKDKILSQWVRQECDTEDFFKGVYSLARDTVQKLYGDIVPLAAPDADILTVTGMEKEVEMREYTFQKRFDAAHEDIEGISYDLANKLFPQEYGAVNLQSTHNLLGYLYQRGQNPVQIAQLLSCLYDKAKELAEDSRMECQRQKVTNGMGIEVFTDPKDRSKTHITPMQALQNKPFFRTVHAHLYDFRQKYVLYVEQQRQACMQYLTDLAVRETLRRLLPKLAQLMKCLTIPYDDLFRQIDNEIYNNTAGFWDDGFVFSDTAAKEAAYGALSPLVELDMRTWEKSIAEFLFGGFYRECRGDFGDGDMQRFYRRGCSQILTTGVPMAVKVFAEITDPITNPLIGMAIARQVQRENPHLSPLRQSLAIQDAYQAALRRVLAGAAVRLLQNEPDFIIGQAQSFDRVTYVCYHSNNTMFSFTGTHYQVSRMNVYPKNELICLQTVFAARPFRLLDTEMQSRYYKRLMDAVLTEYGNGKDAYDMPHLDKRWITRFGKQ